MKIIYIIVAVAILSPFIARLKNRSQKNKAVDFDPNFSNQCSQEEREKEQLADFINRL